MKGSSGTRDLTDMDQDDHHYQQSPKRVAGDGSEERQSEQTERVRGERRRVRGMRHVSARPNIAARHDSPHGIHDG